MKITVCELRNDVKEFETDWQGLVQHVQEESSDLVVLPEMPFHPWLAQTNQVDARLWQTAIEAHDQWLARLPELAPAVVVSTRPVIQKGIRLNQGYLWDSQTGYRRAHEKYYLPDEPGFWEASWYQRGEPDFTTIDAAGVRIGFLICTEMWFYQHARAYAQAGIHLLVTPRGTPAGTVDKWIAGGRAAAVVSGAFSLSANIAGSRNNPLGWGGGGWIIEPQEGQVLGVTSAAEPFLTLTIDPWIAEAAKSTYPRYVSD